MGSYTETTEAASAPSQRDAPPSKNLLFDMLHFDVLRAVLLQLDITSLQKMRRVCKASKKIVESLYEYRTLKQYAHWIIYAVIKIGPASYFTIRELFLEFCHRWCRECGEGVVGNLLCLATLRRCCKGCSRTHAAFKLAPLFYVLAKFGLSVEDVKQGLPVLKRNIRCIQPGRPKVVSQIADIVNVNDAKRLAIEIHGSEAQMKAAGYQDLPGASGEFYRSDMCAAWTTLGAYCFRSSPDSEVEGPSIRLRMTEYLGASDFPFWDRKSQRARISAFESI